jgi:hypothetical protein
MKVSYRSLLLSGIAAAIVAGIGWVSIPPLFFDHPIDVVGFPPLRYPGFQTWPTLRDFDGPGTVFMVSDGAFDIMGKISAPPALVGDEYLGEVHNSGDWKASVLQRFLGKTFLVNAKSDTSINVGFQPEGVQRWRIIPDEVTDQIRKIAKSYKSSSLFLITESISVREVTFSLISLSS